MKNNICFIILALLIMLVFNGCEENTSSNVFDHDAILEGYVTFENASPDTTAANVTVSRNNMILVQTVTDTAGFYHVENLASGEYFVSIDLEEFASFSTMVTLLSGYTAVVDTVSLIAMSSMESRTVIIDGEIDAGWEPVYTDDHVSGWGPNDFTELYMAYDDEFLYIAVTGSFSSADNTASICIDKDGSPETGINDFSLVSGGDLGNQIRKNVTAPEDFGADIAFNSGWALSGEGIVSLENPSAVDQAILENVSTSVNASVMEFAISLEELYSGILPGYISLVAYIGGGGDQYIANDAIPQGSGEFEGTFMEVFTIGF